MTSTDPGATPAHDAPDVLAVHPGDWHAPPARAVRLHAGFMAAILGLCAIGAIAGPMLAMDEFGIARFGVGAGLFLLMALLGALVGARLRHQRWKLDHEGLWLRQGRLWWKESRVPISRVQHVDLKHGPLERRLALATLVVHTAGMHLNGITVRGIPEAEAEVLRDTLARQLDDAADAL